jgi:hypothetical protein
VGALADRWDRKLIMLVADGSRALLLGTVVLAHRLTFPHILVVVLLDGSCFVFFQLAESAALPHIVPRRQLSAAWAHNQSGNWVRRWLGSRWAEHCSRPVTCCRSPRMRSRTWRRS